MLLALKNPSRFQRLRLALSVTALLLLTHVAAAAGDKEITIDTLAGYAPFGMYTDPDNPTYWSLVPPGEDTSAFEGYSWDIIRESFHAEGYTIRLRVAPWARVMYEVREGEADLIYPAGKNKKRLEYLDFSEHPVNDVKFYVYTEAGKELAWHGLSSLKGMTIAKARGWNFGNQWKRNDLFDKKDVSSIDQGFALLEKGRVDGFAGYGIVWDYRLKKSGQKGKFDKSPAFGGTNEFVAALKSNPNGQALLDAFDRGLSKIKANGTLQDIKNKWR